MRATWVFGRHQREGPFEVVARPRGGEVPRTFARQHEGRRGLGPGLGRQLGAGGRRELERLLVVVGDLLGEVGRALAHRVPDPASRLDVLAPAGRPRDLPVGDVADQRVPEEMLGLPGDARGRRTAYQLAPRREVQERAHLVLGHPRDSGHRARPEDPPDHRGVVQQRLQGRWERVHACADQRLQGVGHRDRGVRVGQSAAPGAVEDPLVCEHPHEFLGEERVPAASLDQHRLGLAGQHDPVEQPADQPGGFPVGEWRQHDLRGVRDPPAPIRAAVEQLGARRAQQHDRRAPRTADELVDEVEERGVGPVEILEDQDERVVVRHRLEEPAPRGEQVVAGDIARRPAEAEQRREPRAQPVALFLVGHGRCERRIELLRRHVGRIVVEHAGLGLQHLAERPEAHAFAVREAPPLPPPHEVGQLVDVVGERRHDAGLADPGLARDGHEPQRILVVPCARRLEHPTEDRAELRELVGPAHEGGGRPARVDARARERLERAPDRQRLALALDRHRLERLVPDQVTRGPVGGLADDGPVHGRDRLQARGRVHDVARDALTHLRSGPERHHGLAAVDPDPDGQGRCEPIRARALRDRLLDPEGGQHGADRIVLVGDRCPEHAQHGVADELVDRAPVELDDLLQRGVERAEGGAHVLGVGPVRELGEPDEVAEQDRDEPAFLRGARGERRPAVRAEARALGDRLAADGTGRHVRESSDGAPVALREGTGRTAPRRLP